MEEEAGGVQSLAKEHLEPPEARRGRKESLQKHLEGVCMFLLIPYRQTSALQVAGNRFIFFGAIEFVMICYGRTRATGANTVFKR